MNYSGTNIIIIYLYMLDTGGDGRVSVSSYFPANIGSNQQSAESFLDKPTRGDNILDLI